VAYLVVDVVVEILSVEDMELATLRGMTIWEARGLISIINLVFISR